MIKIIISYATEGCYQDIKGLLVEYAIPGKLRNIRLLTSRFFDTVPLDTVPRI